MIQVHLVKKKHLWCCYTC